ncbi:MAG: glycosyltransferase family 4 protein [Sulfobacillus sp.]
MIPSIYGYQGSVSPTSAHWDWVPALNGPAAPNPFTVWLFSSEVPPYFLGGLGRHVDRLARYLVSRGHQVHVATPYQSDYPLPYHAWSLDDVEKSHPPNPVGTTVIHVHDPRLWDRARQLSLRWGCPLVITWHTLYRAYAHYLSRPPDAQLAALERMVLATGDRHIWVSQFLLRQAQVFYGHLPDAARNTIIGNGVSFPSIDVSQSPKGFPDLLYFGRLEEEKGIDWLLVALSDLISRNPQFQAILCGTGTMQEEIRSLIQLQGWTHNVHAPGMVGDETLARYIQTAQVAVLPSRFEPFGLTALEAMASGMATVLGPAKGYQEFAEPYSNCLQVSTANELSMAVQSLCNDPAFGRQLGHEASRLSENWNWLSVGRKIEREYEWLLRRTREMTGEDTL